MSSFNNLRKCAESWAHIACLPAVWACQSYEIPQSIAAPDVRQVACAAIDSPRPLAGSSILGPRFVSHPLDRLTWEHKANKRGACNP